MKVLLQSRWFLLVLRVVVALLFLYAGITKIGDPQSFADSIATFQMLPPEVINLVALGIPPFEVILALMLLTGWKLRPAAFGILGLTIVFAVALTQALIRGLEVDCGCFGSGEPSILKTWASLGRDLLLMAAIAWVYWRALRDTKTRAISDVDRP
ncbi:MAG: DoxX family membrane protein [Chthoniobacterales bacterium]|nr:DoxX family membrane protein [Chthoniobacterales bacterium]